MSTDWDERYLQLAEHIASWSKDRSTKVGAVIVSKHNRIISTGFNGFPTGVNDDVEERHERPAKYLWTEHAERNAIFSAPRGVELEGSTLYCTWFPCSDCARAIIQSRIGVVWYREKSVVDRWVDSFAVSQKMFDEVGIRVIGK